MTVDSTSADGAPGSVAITGASGMIGQALTALLRGRGARVVPIVRGAPKAGEIGWDPAAGRLDPTALTGIDAVVHLAGENIAGSRWSDAQRERIMASRVQGTTTLVRAITAAPSGPRTLVSASAIGIYGDRGEEILDETSPPGKGFLPDVVTAWEAATAPAAAAGVRVAHTRLAPVLSTNGGLLARVLPVFKLGLGGRLGDGHQWMSWVALDDAIAAIVAVLDGSQSGAFNVSAPEAVTNAEFTRTLGAVVHRPAILAVPAFALRLAFGGLADEGLLASARVAPRRLEALGFRFRHPRLRPALEHALAEAK